DRWEFLFFLKEATVKIEILGPGCARCRATEDNVRRALAELQLEAEIVHITDLLEISRRRVMLTPGLIVDGEIRSSGRIPEVAEIKEWLTQKVSH
ncbi:MAG TPA: thioredoxin family protein, partial [Candidatus Nitrosotenuis sp.]|nr:thioredoxin family protein [Candidatus Nitrosotenuis sp.]